VKMRTLTIRACVVLSSIVLVGLAGAVPAFAEMPWWQVSSISAPAILQPEHEGTLEVIATNLGDANVNTSTSTPVTVTDTLPEGVTAVAASGRAGHLRPFDGNESGDGLVECAVLFAKMVSCTYYGELPPYERLWIDITVKVEPEAKSGALNEVGASGGGTRGASVKRHLSIGGGPTPFGVEDNELTPEEEGGGLDTHAGSHPFQLTSTTILNQAGLTPEYLPTQPAAPKDLHFTLPAGMVGNPTAFPRCTEAQFSAEGPENNDECPADSAVGVAAITAYDPTGFYDYFAEPVPLFNLEPDVGEPAKFGFEVKGSTVALDTSVKTGGGYNIVVDSNNITETAEFIAARVTFWGVPGDPRHNISRGWGCIGNGRVDGHEVPCVNPEVTKPPPLLTLPTSCAIPFETSVTGDSWTEAGKFTTPVVYSLKDASETPEGLDGCNRLPFAPEISVAPDGTQASTPTGLTVNIHVPQDATLNDKGLAESSVKNTTVALPAGMQISPAGADGLEACSEEQVALSVDGEATCPNGSKVATAEIKSPLLPNPLVGQVYLAAQNANPFGSLVAMYIAVKDPVSGVIVKVAGEVKLDPVSGQLVSTFNNTPQLPFEDLSLHFFGSARAPLSTPPSCGTYTTTTSIEGWAGNPASTPSSSFQITSGPDGSACAAPRPFTPELQSGSLNLQAGAFTPFELTMTRPDADQTLGRIEMSMPPGLLGTLSHVALCPEPQAAMGTCGPQSLIGETTTSVGLGNAPYTVTGGKVYITTGYDGAPYGLSIANPAKAGPYDLEAGTPCDCIVVRAKMEVDRYTAALKIKSDPLPTILQGIPLQIQHVNVSVNRELFTFNPTNCNKTAVNATLTSSEGTVSHNSTPFQVTNCAVLGFKPSFMVSTNGKTSRARGASLHVKLVYPKAPFGSQANIKSVKVDLPKQLPSRLTTLQKACAAATFNANPASCPAASKVGTAKATTPLLPVPLTGPAYFVSHGGEEFPSLIVVLQGYGTTVDLVGSTFIGKGITSSTFKTVPDVPVGTFELTLPQGKFSALAANGNLCKSKLKMPTAFTAQNGAVIHQSTPISVTGCPKAKKKKKK
jgi:uncharacterized repeat protein (TIGR01451 family)